MKMPCSLPAIVVLIFASPLALAQKTPPPDAAQLQKMAARFAPTEITADLSKLAPNDRKVLAKLVEAAKIIDGIFLRQMWTQNPSMLLELAGDDSPQGRARLHYFLLNKGPWSNLDDNAPFVALAPAKPPGAGFYPADTTKEQMESWMKSLPPNEQERARGFFTVIRRDGKNFALVPYRLE